MDKNSPRRTRVASAATFYARARRSLPDTLAPGMSHTETRVLSFVTNAATPGVRTTPRELRNGVSWEEGEELTDYDYEKKKTKKNTGEVNRQLALGWTWTVMREYSCTVPQVSYLNYGYSGLRRAMRIFFFFLNK